MIQSGLIQNAHGDLVTDASYDFYGLRLATSSLDQRIKVWQLDENNTWGVQDDWKAHDAAISKLSWAHPEFGSILASASFDRTVKIWEHTTTPPDSQPTVNGNGTMNSSHAGSGGPVGSRWVERAVLADAKGTVRAVEFAPHHFGLKLATLSTDNTLRIYDCVEQPSLASWLLTEELDVINAPASHSPGYLTRAQTVALATPTQTSSLTASNTDTGASASLVAQALQQHSAASGGNASGRGGAGGNREADGGWCISWCKDKYWGEIIAAGASTSGVVKIIQINARRSSTLLTLNSNVPSTTSGSGSGQPSNTNTSSSQPTTATATSNPPAPSTTNPATAPSSSAPTTTNPSTTASSSINTNTNTTTTTNTTTNAPVGPSTNASNITTSNTPSTTNPTTTTSTAAATSIPNTTNTANTNTNAAPAYAITSVAWAPSCGRSYHLVATGSRDGHVRIWKIRPGSEDIDMDTLGDGDVDADEARWSAVLVGDFDQHKSAVGRVEWNITGTILSSAGNDGRIRLWKASSGNVWRSAGSVGVEQTEEQPGVAGGVSGSQGQGEGEGGKEKDVEMDG